MRRDMNKVLIERTRRGGRGKQRKVYEKACRSQKRYRDEAYGIAVDDAPQKVSMRRPHVINGNYKEFSDLLSPLVRFLRANAGRPWNDVWSEICKVMKGNGLQADHVKGHVKQYVGGIPHSGIRYYGYMVDVWAPNSSDPVYVDSNGILRKNPDYGNRRRYRRREKYNYYRESATVEYHKFNGAWFRVEINKETIEKFYRSYSGGVYARKEVAYSIYKKKTLSKKEIKKLDLDNRFEYTPPTVVLEKEKE